MLEKLLLGIITLLHILVILFVLLAPFSNSNYILMLHAIFVPFLIFHWITNNNTCCLTVAEKAIRKSSGTPDEAVEDNCFTCKLIEPIYDFKNNYESMSTIIYVITIALWLISVGKLYMKYHRGEISSWSSLFMY